MTGSEEEAVSKGILEGLIDALTDKHTQMEIEFKRLSVTLPGQKTAIEISGSITVAVRMSDTPVAQS